MLQCGRQVAFYNCGGVYDARGSMNEPEKHLSLLRDALGNAHCDKLQEFLQFDSKFLQGLVAPTEKAKAATHVISEALRKSADFSVAEVHKEGSMGKQTASFNSDLDLVIYLSDFDEKNYEDYLRKAQPVMAALADGGKARVTRYSVQFKWQGLDIDLLFGRPLSTAEASQSTKDANDNFLSASFSPLHSSIIWGAANLKTNASKAIPKDIVKKILALPSFGDLARALKYWRSLWPWPSKKPPSYLLELCALDHYFERLSKPLGKVKLRSLRSCFAAVLRILANPRLMTVIPARYTDLMIKLQLKPVYNITQVDTALLETRPLVLDLANPANNLTTGYDPHLTAAYAAQTLALMRIY